MSDSPQPPSWFMDDLLAKAKKEQGTEAPKEKKPTRSRSAQAFLDQLRSSDAQH